jgi:hypothetical protein
MGNRVEKTNTGEGGKDKRVKTTSDDPGGKSVSEKSKCENSTVGKSDVIHSSGNIFEE